MEAILLVGGKGTRLLPLTIDTPKPMIKLAGVRFIAYQIAYARSHGISRIVVATSYKTEQFLEYLGDGSAFGVEIVHAIEGEPLGTGGAIANAATYLISGEHDPITVLNGDVLTAHDISAQIRQHVSMNCDATLHLVEVDDARAYGSVPTDDKGQIIEFVEKSENPPTNFINAGCYIFTKSVIDQIPRGRVVSVERETFPELLATGGKLWSFKSRDYWIDIGTPAALFKGSRDLVNGEFKAGAGTNFGAESLATGGSSIGANCRIGSGVSISNSIIGDGVIIGDGAEIRDSFILHGTILEPGSKIFSKYLSATENLEISPY